MGVEFNDKGLGGDFWKNQAENMGGLVRGIVYALGLELVEDDLSEELGMGGVLVLVAQGNLQRGCEPDDRGNIEGSGATP